MNLMRLLITCLGLATSLLTASLTMGQGIADNRSILHVDGTFQGMARMIIKVVDADGTEILVQLPQDLTRVRFNADADPQGLRPGMMVRFQASFGPGGVPLEAVKQVEIFHPLRQPKMPARVAETMTPGIYPEAKAPANRAGGFVPGKYRIVGSLVGVAPGGWLVVSTGQTPIRVMMDQGVKFVVRTHSLELAQPGDRVTLDGFYNEPDKTKVVADTLTVSTDRVIGTPAEVPMKGRRRRGKADAEQEQPKAAEEKPALPAEAAAE